MDRFKILMEDIRELSLIDLLDLYIEALTGKSGELDSTAPGDVLDMIEELESYINNRGDN